MNAIECFHKHHRATTHRRWQPFSFDEVCEFLSLDPECLRTGLRHWYEPQHSGSEPHEWMT